MANINLTLIRRISLSPRHEKTSVMQRYDDYVCLIRQPVEALLGAEATMNITQISGIIYDGARPLDFNITSRRRVWFASIRSIVAVNRYPDPSGQDTE